MGYDLLTNIIENKTCGVSGAKWRSKAYLQEGERSKEDYSHEYQLLEEDRGNCILSIAGKRAVQGATAFCRQALKYNKTLFFPS
jgi:hypothetical protein